MPAEPTFEGAKGDTQPPIRVQLYDGASPKQPVSLGSNDTVTFTMWPVDGGATVVAAVAAAINDRGDADSPADVQYNWAAGDVDDPGTFYAQFEVTWQDLAGDPTTKFPRPRPMIVRIADSRA